LALRVTAGDQTIGPESGLTGHVPARLVKVESVCGAKLALEAKAVFQAEYEAWDGTKNTSPG
jgi:hypothetical protein